MLETKRYILIVDYNLTRVKDVRLLTKYAKEKYDLESILIRPNPSQSDYNLAHIVLNLNPRSPNFVSDAINYLSKYAEQIMAILPFSDNAVQAGAQLGEQLGKLVDSSLLADCAFSKIRYREREAEVAEYLAAQDIFVPKFAVVDSTIGLYEFARKCSNGFVIKPACEGNNRGVIKLDDSRLFEQAFAEVKQYLKDGIICEEIIPFPLEFSFDGIGQFNFITQKQSKLSKYPVEFGQIVPALAHPKILDSVERAGRIANLLCGQRVGPYHNEIKVDPVTFQSAIVEPNRRPAGMKIWYLANHVFDINLFELWIDQLLGKVQLPKVMQAKRIAAIHELSAPNSGRIKSDISHEELEKNIFNSVVNKLNKQNDIKWFDFVFHKKPGEFIGPEIKDNSGFLAEVCCFSDDLEIDIGQRIREFENVWMKIMSNYMEEENEYTYSAPSTVFENTI